MSDVVVEGEFAAGVDAVWEVVGSFGGLMEALGVPFELEGEGVGQTRKISMGAEPTVERLEELDQGRKRLVYSIVSGALPLVNYRSTMQLVALAPDRTKLTWSSTFQPAAGTNETDATNLVSSIYRGGIGGLQRRFGS